MFHFYVKYCLISLYAPESLESPFTDFFFLALNIEGHQYFL